MKRAWLFLTFVWRESPGGGRVDVQTAWALAGIWSRISSTIQPEG